MGAPRVQNNFFKTWSHEMAYVLGYFAADGNMSSFRGGKRILFASIDKTLLDNVREIMGIEVGLKKHTAAHDNAYVLRFYNANLYDQLIDLGLTERKSLTIKYPNVPEEYESSFIRGVFDGDGWISRVNSGTRFGICSGSRVFLVGLRKALEKLLGRKIKIYADGTSNIYSIRVCDVRDVSILYQYLYFNSTEKTRLDRKYNLFTSVKKIDCYVIPPVSALRFIQYGTRNCLCLAHLYLTYPNYRELFLKLRRDKRRKFITLDNSAAERSLVTVEKLLEVVTELKPDEVISPDILFNKEQTIKNLEDFVTLMKQRNLITHTKIFGCPQGSTREEWLECYNYMLQHADVSVIGLSKISVPKCWLDKIDDQGIKEARHLCVDYLLSNNLIKKQIHFLGMGDPTEYQDYNHILFRSTDSCYTLLAAMNNIRFGHDEFKRVPTPHDYFERDFPSKLDKLAWHNIRYLRDNLGIKRFNYKHERKS